MWLLAQDVTSPISAEVFNYFAGTAAVIILALVAAIGILYRAADNDKGERLTDMKELLNEQKEILTGALETTNKVGSSMDTHGKQLEKVEEALKLNTIVLEQVRKCLENA